MAWRRLSERIRKWAAQWLEYLGIGLPCDKKETAGYARILRGMDAWFIDSGLFQSMLILCCAMTVRFPRVACGALQEFVPAAALKAHPSRDGKTKMV
jgi:hypothetical protein